MKILKYKTLVTIVLISLLNGGFVDASTNSKYPHMCDPKNRPQVCTEEYVGVCGWFGLNIQCIAYPCAMTHSTICKACSNTMVEKVTLGVCPKTGSKPPDDSSSTQSPASTTSSVFLYTSMLFFTIIFLIM